MDVEQRLSRLERQNRVYRTLIGVLIVAIAAIGLIGAASPTQASIRTRELVIVDAMGRAVATLDSSESNGRLSFLDANGTLVGSYSGHAAVTGGDKGAIVLITGPDGAAVFLNAGNGRHVDINSNGPTVELADAENYSLQLGQSKLKTTQTGEISTTSAASMKMFGSNKKLLWSAP